ncbi:hypothetical protein FRC09_016895 [Ceratobasidium sp. 395]|nr:hypothetical protein FRC09_016895 [Ceratobasidium sp. 395]
MLNETHELSSWAHEAHEPYLDADAAHEPDIGTLTELMSPTDVGDALSDECKDSEDSEDGEHICKGREGEANEVELVIDVPADLKTQAKIDEYATRVLAKYLKTGKLSSKPNKRVPAPAKPVACRINGLHGSLNHVDYKQ